MICSMSCTVIVDMLTWLGCAQGTDIDCYHRRPTGALRFSRSHSCHGEFQGKLGCSLRASASSSFRKTPPWPVPGSASRARAQHVDKDPDIVPVCVIVSNCVACLSTRRLRAFHLIAEVGRRPQASRRIRAPLPRTPALLGRV